MFQQTQRDEYAHDELQVCVIEHPDLVVIEETGFLAFRNFLSTLSDKESKATLR